MENETLGGEVWMDERGKAVVVLPDHLHCRELEYEYRLTSPESAEVGAEIADGRLTITSAVPHVKVAWRLAYRAEAPCEHGPAPHLGLELELEPTTEGTAP